MLYEFLEKDGNIIAIGDIDAETLAAKIEDSYKDCAPSTLDAYEMQTKKPIDDKLAAFETKFGAYDTVFAEESKTTGVDSAT